VAVLIDATDSSATETVPQHTTDNKVTVSVELQQKINILRNHLITDNVKAFSREAKNTPEIKERTEDSLLRGLMDYAGGLNDIKLVK